MPASAASCSACLKSHEFITDLPSSLTAAAPASFIPAISVISTPSWPNVIAPTGSIWTGASFALSSKSITIAGESITGFVFGIGHIVVTPPFAAACAPVMTVSLYSKPGSLKCTCKSTKPGIIYLPEASITSAPAAEALLSLIFSETSRTLPPDINISILLSILLAGSVRCPFLIKYLSIPFSILKHIPQLISLYAEGIC